MTGRGLVLYVTCPHFRLIVEVIFARRGFKAEEMEATGEPAKVTFGSGFVSAWYFGGTVSVRVTATSSTGSETAEVTCGSGVVSAWTVGRTV